MYHRDAQELQRLDAAVDRIFQAVPDHPYILSVPCDEPRFHYPTRQEAESWQRHTPFSLDEERLQYMTYIYREPGESCFVVRSQVDEERDRQKAQQPAQKVPTPSFLSGTSTPKQGVKKKISLSAYKSKLAGGPVEYIETAPAKKEEKIKSKMVETKVNGVTAGPTPSRSQEALQSGSSSKKRPHADSNVSSNDHKHSPHPVKRPRKATPTPPESKHSQASHPNGAPHDLPPLLSPTFLPVTELSDWDLPPILSPTLPPQIEAALLEEEKKPKASPPSMASSNSAAPSPAADSKKAKSHVTLNPTPSKIRPPEREKSPLPKIVLPAKPAEKPTKTVPKIVGRKDMERTHTPIRKAADEPKPSKAEHVESKSLMVKLKYKKKNRNQIERILRLPPRPHRDHLRAKQIADAKEGENSQARASSSAFQVAERSTKQDIPRSSQPDRLKATNIAEKRPRTEDSDAPPAKRPKGLDLDKKPSTPIQAPLLSPAVIKSSGSGKAPAQATPRNDHLKSVAMNRSISNESNAPTPGGKRNHLTPAGTPLSKTGDKGPTSAPSNVGGGARAVQLRALNELSAKYNKLGRKLKHENQAVYQNSKDNAARTEDDRKRAALLGLECILSYMLAYSLGDARRRLEGKLCELENTWISLMPLFRHLGGSTRHFRDLSGLHAHLGVAINSRISSAIIERMVRTGSTNPVAADSPQGGPPSSEASGVTSVNHDPKHLNESWRAMSEHSREGAMRLSVEEIMKKFPATWESRGREKDVIGKDMEVERLVGERGEPLFRGKYFLPVSVDTSPIQAIRLGVQFVGEWCKKEMGSYETQVKL